MGSEMCIRDSAFHTVENRNRMAEGIALTDQDRAPWLDRLADELTRMGELGLPAVLACSALKRSYRDVLRGCGFPVTVVQLQVSPEDLAARVAARRAHFMPSSLLASQIALMEPLEADEEGVTVPTGPDPESTAAAVLTALGL